MLVPKTRTSGLSIEKGNTQFGSVSMEIQTVQSRMSLNQFCNWLSELSKSDRYVLPGLMADNKS